MTRAQALAAARRTVAARPYGNDPLLAEPAVQMIAQALLEAHAAQAAR